MELNPCLCPVSVCLTLSACIINMRWILSSTAVLACGFSKPFSVCGLIHCYIRPGLMTSACLAAGDGFNGAHDDDPVQCKEWERWIIVLASAVHTQTHTFTSSRMQSI